MSFRSGRHFLQLPGPTNVPDRILRAMNRATIDHRGAEFGLMGLRILKGMQDLFRTEGHVFVYPASGTGAWEAAVVNTLSPGDLVVGFDSGVFAEKWAGVCRNLGLQVELLPSDWHSGIDPGSLERRLREDTEGHIKAVTVVHNETSTGVTNDVSVFRGLLDEVGHSALLMVDAVSSLCTTDVRHDDWGLDVTISASQKGLMLPPGLSFAAVSRKALDAHAKSNFPRSYWDWSHMLRFSETGYFPYTPATGLLYGLDEALRMLQEEGLEHTFQRHARLAEATRRAVAAWGLERFCTDATAVSSSVTSVQVPEGADADEVRRVVFERFDMSLGGGLGRLKGQVFRIGHLGDFNELMLSGTLCGVEMGLALARVAHEPEGVRAALDYLAQTSEVRTP